MEKSKGSICLGESQGRSLLMGLGQLLVRRTCSLEEELNAEWREQEQAGTSLHLWVISLNHDGIQM